MAVFGYARVSTEEQADGTSLSEQRRQIAGLAMTAGLEGLEYVEDAGVSGITPILRRPAGARLADLQRGDVVIVAKLDRLSRDLIDALTVIRDWEAAGVRLIINGYGDCTGPYAQGSTGRLVIEVMAVFAGHERRVLKERQRDGQAAKRRAGGHIGGAPPFGFRKVGAGRAARLEADPAQQEAIATMRDLAAEGMSSRAIAAAVQERHGVSVSHVTVRMTLSREVPAATQASPTLASAAGAAHG
jgi:DNA invertase Pin-like site-specific DNA recombinase